MLLKPRTESTELQIMNSLYTRMTLSDKDQKHFFNLQKGFEGEVMFDRLTEKLRCECLILNDLLLKANNTIFQLDTLILLPDILYLFEVKNFEGDYFYESDQIFSKARSEITNPLLQLSRSESLLRQLLTSLRIKLPIVSSVVFINPSFTLYQAPIDKPFIFPTQINRYLKKLDSSTLKLNEQHRKLADQLISLHLPTSPFTQVPSYNFDQLKKGIICAACRSFSIEVLGKNCICKVCEHKETIGDAVMRSVREFQLLFPNEKITTNVIYEWCGGVGSKRIIRKILKENFTIVGVHQWAYFIEN